MASLDISTDTRDEITESPVEEHGRHTDESKIICLGFAAEDGYGDKELLLHEHSLLSVTTKNLQDSKAYNLLRSPDLIPLLKVVGNGQNDIVYFDHDTLEELELYQTRPLQRAADTKNVAVDWSSILNEEKLKETLLTVYSQLRSIERIILVIDNSSQGSIVQEVQEMIQNQAFWQECNRQYALEQILPVRMRPSNTPQINIIRIARDCKYEGDSRQTPQITPLPHELAPDSADIELLNPAQQEVPASADYSLQRLLN
ncbi:hypothetical protein EV127DRAFT_13155 [Xylaria flabelliformis]|nr:hypothetical protein EV127DRAFT_13155 [Xylaria flabelliformis]